MAFKNRYASPSAIKVLFLILFPLLLLSLLFFSLSPFNPPSSDVDLRDSASFTPANPDQGSRLNIRASNLLHNLNNLASRPAYDGEEENELVPITDEERDLLLYRQRMISPQFFDMAPDILEDILLEQPDDPLWTMKVSNSTEESLEKHGLSGTGLMKTDCRATICKVELIHLDGDARDSFRKVVTTLEQFSGDMHGDNELLPSGEVVSSVYFTMKNDDDTFDEMRNRMLALVEQNNSN